MRKSTKYTLYLLSGYALYLLLGSFIKIDNVSLFKLTAKYGMPLFAVALIAVWCLNAKAWFQFHLLAYRLWKKTGKLNWSALQEYQLSNRSMEEIEKEYLEKHAKSS